MAAGLSDRPKPTRSGHTTRYPAAATIGIIRRYKNDHDGSPCSISTGSASGGPVFHPGDPQTSALVIVDLAILGR